MIFELSVFCMALASSDLQARSYPDVAKAHSDMMKISMEDISVPERNRRIEAVFKSVKSEVDRISLSHMKDADVKEYFDISHFVAFDTLKPEFARIMRSALDEMSHRKLDVLRPQQDMLKIYVADRMLDDVRKYAASVRDGMALPRFEDDAISHGAYPTLWYLSGDASSVLRYSYPLNEGTKVVVTGHPWCHFSRNAAKDIEDDLRIANLMERYSIWVVPQHPMPNFSDIAQWNVQHPRLRMRVAYNADEWPAISNWATPTFFFFKDGRLIDTVTGWPDARQADRLMVAFRAVGVE